MFFRMLRSFETTFDDVSNLVKILSSTAAKIDLLESVLGLNVDKHNAGFDEINPVEDLG